MSLVGDLTQETTRPITVKLGGKITTGGPVFDVIDGATLLEGGDFLLLESGDKILYEGSS